MSHNGQLGQNVVNHGDNVHFLNNRFPLKQNKGWLSKQAR